VLTYPDPAAYLIPGWPDRVVVTSGAVDRLPQAELNAVLAHERAHAAGRHHRWCALAGLLHHAYPSVPVFTHAQRQITRLVELCADATAARTQSPLALARALVTMAEAAAAPTAVLPAGGGDITERVIRLLQPPQRLPTALRVATAVAFLTLPLVPVLVLLLEPLIHLNAFTM
jgi:Zn-dependent protease with chaperone function